MSPIVIHPHVVSKICLLFMSCIMVLSLVVVGAVTTHSFHPTSPERHDGGKVLTGADHKASIVHSRLDLKVRMLASGNVSNEVVYCYDKDFTFTLDTVAGTTCECDGSKLTFDCKTPEYCVDSDDCTDTVCAYVRNSLKYTIMSDTLALDYLETETFITSGADYQGLRFSTNGYSCNQYIYLNGSEYKCNSCAACSETAYHFDCSNIQKNSTSNKTNCVAPTDSDDDIFDLCPAGGVMKPTTTGFPIGTERIASAGMLSFYSACAHSATIFSTLLIIVAVMA